MKKEKFVIKNKNSEDYVQLVGLGYLWGYSDRRGATIFKKKREAQIFKNKMPDKKNHIVIKLK